MKPSAKNLRPSAAFVVAVAFDCYGTLIDFTEPDFIAAMAEICDQQGLEADAADLWRRFVRAAFALRSENHERPLYRRYQEVWALQFQRVFRQLRLSGDSQAASAYLKEKLATAQAYPEAHAVLDALRPRYRLAVLTNADDDFLLACLEKNGLQFDAVITSERAGAIKPNPAIFRYAAAVLDLPLERILYVGDSPIPDVMGARQAGMPVVWVNRLGLRRPHKVPPPDAKVRSLAELVPLLISRQGPSPDLG